jgi:predicted HicB family RNase H-like nuclease
MEPREILKKPYARMIVRDTDGTFMAEIVEFPGCFAIGDSASKALSKLDEVAIDWIAASLDRGQEIPEPMEAAEFSGKLVLRMPKGLHKRAALCAEREGTSLNQFIVTCVAEQIGFRARPMLVYTQPAAVSVNFDFENMFAELTTASRAQGAYGKALTTSVGRPQLLNIPILGLSEGAHA